MNPIKIAPSILAVKDISLLEEEIKKVELAGADLIHMDVMDGIFVPNKTPFLDPKIITNIKERTKLPLDVHLMVQNPEKYINHFLTAGANILTIHAEADGDKELLLKIIKSAGAKAGIALNPNTAFEQHLDLCKEADMILCMTVVPGKGGQQYIEMVNEKIKQLRKLLPEKDIEVDGGVKAATAYLPINAGANILVSGTGIFQESDYEKAINKMKEIIFIGADHAGYQLKEKIEQWLQQKQYAVLDAGTDSEESCDYPDFAKKVGEAVSKNKQKGILICGTGIGMSIAANKVKGIRAAHVSSKIEVELAKKHNDANILCLGARILEEKTAKEIVEKWLSSEFEAGRHQQRIEKIEKQEQ